MKSSGTGSSARASVLSGKVVNGSSTPASGGAKRLQVTLAGEARLNASGFGTVAGIDELSARYSPDGGLAARGGRLGDGYYSTDEGVVGVGLEVAAGGPGYGERHTVSEVLPGVVTSGRKALKVARLAAAGGRGSGSGDLGVSAAAGRERRLTYGDEEDQALGGWQQQQRKEEVEGKEAGEEGGEEGGVQPRRKRSKKMKPEVDNAMADAAADALLALNSG